MDESSTRARLRTGGPDDDGTSPPRRGKRTSVTRMFPSEPARHELRRLAASRQRNLTQIAVALGIDRATLNRLLNRQWLRSDAADHIAIALGNHPGVIWPDWFAGYDEETAS